MSMTAEQLAQLREVAERATPGDWRRASTRFNGITATPFTLGGEEVMLASASEKRDAEFIAAFHPAIALALLDELERKDKSIAELERMTPEERSKHDAGIKELAALLAAPAVQAEQLSGNTEQVSQPTLPEGYLQGYKDGCEWSALMAEANHPQTGDWLFDDPIELAKAIRKGPDMLPAEPGNSPVIPEGWTGSDKANAALVMLDRIDTVDPVDDDRIEGIKRIIRELAAAPKQEANNG